MTKRLLYSLILFILLCFVLSSCSKRVDSDSTIPTPLVTELPMEQVVFNTVVPEPTPLNTPESCSEDITVESKISPMPTISLSPMPTASVSPTHLPEITQPPSDILDLGEFENGMGWA